MTFSVKRVTTVDRIREHVIIMFRHYKECFKVNYSIVSIVDRNLIFYPGILQQ